MIKFIMVTLLSIVSYILLGGVGLTNLFNFIDIQSMLFLLFFVIVMLLFSGYLKDFITAFKIISDDSTFNTLQIKRSIEAVKLVIVISLLGGLLGTANGAVIVFANAEHFTSILAAMSVAFLTLHYSLFIAILLYPIKAMLSGKLYKEL